MRRFPLLTILVCVLATLHATPQSASARSAPVDRPDGEYVIPAGVAAAETSPLFRTHENSQVRTAVTNWGVIGNWSLDLIDSSTLGTSDTLPAPSFESPPGSGINYLFEAGLWIGGIVAGDTLVSTANMDWPPRNELRPPLSSPPVFTDTLGDEEFRSVMFDTLTDPGIVDDDDIDGIHRPLPIRVELVTRLVDEPAFGQGLIVEATITNIGSESIDDFWVGWHTDADVGLYSNSNRWRDDISGFRDTTVAIDGNAYDIAAAWSADNDGDPDSTTLLFTDNSPTRLLGVMHLGSTPALPMASFNWWQLAFVQAYDWGPSRDPANTNSDGGFGRMEGDAARYDRMANGEIDYDQVYSALDFTADGWIPPTEASIATDIANGADTRFLLTRGAIDLAPGEAITTAWAFALGYSFHTDPLNFTDQFDADNPDAYIAGLNFAPFDTAMGRLIALWATDFNASPVGPPRDVHIESWNDSIATVAWRLKATERLAGYNIYRSLDPLTFSDPPVAMLSRSDDDFTDVGLSETSRYFYVVRSVDSMGREGIASPPVDVIPNRPMKPLLLSAERGNGAVHLSWVPPSETDVVAHRIYRSEDGQNWQIVGTTYADGSATDGTAQNATPYQYRIGAVTALKTESFPSNSVLGVAFSFAGDPLVIDHTLSGPTSLTDKDSVAAVWQRITDGIMAEYRNADPLTTAPFELDVYNTHPAAIIVADGRQAPQASAKEQSDIYMYGDGVSIWTGRDLFNENLVNDDFVFFNPGDFAYDNFGITGAYYPRVLRSHPTRPNAEFIGARSTVVGLPSLSVDSSRTDWGLNPALPSAGNAVPFVGYFLVDTARAEIIYRYVSRDSTTSDLHNQAVGVVSKVPGVHGAALSVPLSYIEDAESAAAINALLVRLGWIGDMPGDLDGDGALTSVDLSIMIDYLFRGGSVTNINNVDVNGDCSVNLVDVVVLVDALFFNGGPLQAGCVAP
ncbi:MAG: hypothetical protein GF341_04880 [candidate division Zixibacteria bacterium]|nr:hypothetical protein [candidate division Zixibacteria bacterium]